MARLHSPRCAHGLSLRIIYIDDDGEVPAKQRRETRIDFVMGYIRVDTVYNNGNAKFSLWKIDHNILSFGATNGSHLCSLGKGEEARLYNQLIRPRLPQEALTLC